MDQRVVSQPVNKYCQALYQAGEVVVYRTGSCDPYSLEGMSHITQMLSSMTNAIKEKHRGLWEETATACKTNTSSSFI